MIPSEISPYSTELIVTKRAPDYTVVQGGQFLEAKCKADEQVTGGGYPINTDSPSAGNTNVEQLYPSDENSWIVRAVVGEVEMRAVALCAKLTNE